MRDKRLVVILLGCAAIVLGVLAMIRNQAAIDDELLGGGVIAAGLGLIVSAL